jgi:hypothetical protein
MYINPFVAGVLFTVFTEIAVVVIGSVIINSKKKQKGGK